MWTNKLDEESNLRCGELNGREYCEELHEYKIIRYNAVIPYSVSPKTINDNNTFKLFPNLLRLYPEICKVLRFLSYKRMKNTLTYKHNFWNMIYETNSWESFKHEIKSQGGGQLRTCGENITNIPRYQIEIAFTIYEVTIQLCYKNKYTEINTIKDIIRKDLIPFLEKINTKLIDNLNCEFKL